MRDLLREGSAWLQRQQTRFAAQTVTFLRGDSSVSLTAQIGRTEFQLDNGNGLFTATESRDYLVRACDLMLDDIEVVPQKGDRFIEGDLADGNVFEVLNPAGGDLWRWSDPERTRYRIHTKFV